MAQVLWNTDIDVYNDKVIPLSVARTITWYLDVPDLLSFSLASKNAYRAVRDPGLWVSKLQAMGVWNGAEAVGEHDLASCDFSSFNSPLLCLERIYKAPRLARLQVLKIRRCLHEFYKDLSSDVQYNRLKIFKMFHTPQEQARLLSNLLKYNAMDTDDSSRVFVREKITDILEIFENALLRELEIHFDIQDYEKTRSFVEILVALKNDQTLIDFFLQKTCFDNETIKFLNPEIFAVDEFFAPGAALVDDLDEPALPAINSARVDDFVAELSSVFNDLSRTIDVIFPQSVPMMYKISEELITNQLQEVILVITTAAKEKGLYLQLVPLLYKKLTHDFMEQLEPSQNMGESFKPLVHGLIDVTYDSYVSEYINEEKLVYRQYCGEKLRKWKLTLEEREAETTQKILKNVKVEAKNDFLSNFKKVFIINPNADPATKNGGEEYSAMQAHARILAENIKSLNKVFSPELALDLLQEARNSLARLYHFSEFTINTVLTEVYATMQEEFMNVVDCLGSEHLKVGFERSLKYLKDYNPKDMSSLLETSSSGSVIAPLVIFFESIHAADMIVQMLDIFYKEEILNKNIVRNENSVLNPSLQSKKKLEGAVDKFVADGLNIGIDVLFREIDSVYLSLLSESDYNPPQAAVMSVGPTQAAQKVVSILEDNIDSLVDAAEMSIVEVFQQEVAERFFQVIVKVLKRSVISVDGAVRLISDMNLYYEFILTHIKSNKSMIFPLFQALKKVGTIYLIGGEDSKAIGQIVSDLSKFNGIFSQEEIYEFVQRRQDWSSIKKPVEKVMYGLSIGDCAIV